MREWYSRLIRRISLEKVYVLYVFTILILQFLFWMTPGFAQNVMGVYLWPASITMLSLLLYQRRKDQIPMNYVPLLALTLWVFCTCLLNGDRYLTYNLGYMLGILLACGLCYPTFFWIGRESRKSWFRVFAALFVSILSLLACLGIYAAACGKTVPNPLSEEGIGMFTDDNRLYLFGQHPNGSASVFSVAFFLASYLFLSTKSVLTRCVLVPTSIVLYIGIALTDSRTVMGALSIGVGLLVMIIFTDHTLSTGKSSKRLYRGLAAILTAVLLFASFKPAARFILSLQPEVTPIAQVNGIIDTGTSKSSMESAASIAPTIPYRTYANDIATLRGRTDIWLAALQAVQERPITLLTGMLDSNVARIPITMLGRAGTYHLHNILIEALLLTGIPGLLLCIYFIVRLLRSSLRLMHARYAPLSIRMLSILPIVLLLNGMMEAYPFWGGRLIDMMFFLLAGIVVAFDGEYTTESHLSDTCK